MQVDDAHDIDAVMPVYNLIECSDNYSRKLGILWQYCRDKPALDDDNVITDFTVANSITDLFKIKEKLTGQTGKDGTENVEIMVLLKYLRNFWRILEMLLINCEINLDLNCSKNCVIVGNNPDQDTTFSITDTKLYVPGVTLST